MSEISALTELANFIGKSPLASEDASLRRRTMDGLSARFLARSQRRSVGEMLSAVLALSNRTRRSAQPRAQIRIDVFAPGGMRAVRLRLE